MICYYACHVCDWGVDRTLYDEAPAACAHCGSADVRRVDLSPGGPLPAGVPDRWSRPRFLVRPYPTLRGGPEK